MKQTRSQQEGGGTDAPVRTADKAVEVARMVYDRATPLWSKYYKKVRKSIRFPRYYKRAVNW